jgi:large subunit ribosomal protein L10
MSLNLEDKKKIVAEIAKNASSAFSAAIADCRGLSANQMSSLRRQARESGVYVKVVRNNLAKLALKHTEFECTRNVFSGSLILAFSQKESGSSAKLFKNFMEENDKFKVKYLAIGGKLFGADKLDEMSKLPSRKEALDLFCGVLLAPITKITQTLHDIPRKIVSVFNNIKSVK